MQGKTGIYLSLNRSLLLSVVLHDLYVNLEIWKSNAHKPSCGKGLLKCRTLETTNGKFDWRRRRRNNARPAGGQSAAEYASDSLSQKKRLIP